MRPLRVWSSSESPVFGQVDDGKRMLVRSVICDLVLFERYLRDVVVAPDMEYIPGTRCPWVTSCLLARTLVPHAPV